MSSTSFLASFAQTTHTTGSKTKNILKIRFGTKSMSGHHNQNTRIDTTRPHLLRVALEQNQEMQDELNHANR